MLLPEITIKLATPPMQHAMELIVTDWIQQLQELGNQLPLGHHQPRLEWLAYEIILTELAIKVRKRNANLKMKYSLRLTQREMVAIHYVCCLFDRPKHYPSMGTIYDQLVLQNSCYFTKYSAL